MRADVSADRPRGLYAVLGLGVCAVSVAAPLIKAASAPALSIAAYRLLLASLPVVALALWRRRRELQSLSRASWLAVLLSGLCLAAHFATWVASLQFGTVASSVALVTTSPLFVAILALVFAGERTSRRMLTAIAVCAAGGAVIGMADFRGGGQELWGDALALAGAAFAAGYLALGRRVRAGVSALGYVGAVYPVAALTLLLAAVAARQPLAGFAPRTYVILLLLALVPQVLGHSSLNWSLGYLSAPFVAIAILGEPVIATLLAAVFLGEMPGWERVLGGILILAGVYLALRVERGRPAAGSGVALTSEASA
jgi:drug/metabolite transporter (DMT)-like permease